MTLTFSYRLDYEVITRTIIFVIRLIYFVLFYFNHQKLPPMKNVPVILTSDSVDMLVANIAEELLKGHNTYKSETAALKKKIKIGMLRTFSYQEAIEKQRQKVA
jgi:hypothetical protein